MKVAKNPAAFSESETERRSRFGSSERQRRFFRASAASRQREYGFAVTEPEPIEWSPVTRVGTTELSGSEDVSGP